MKMKRKSRRPCDLLDCVYSRQTNAETSKQKHTHQRLAWSKFWKRKPKNNQKNTKMVRMTRASATTWSFSRFFIHSCSFAYSFMSKIYEHRKFSDFIHVLLNWFLVLKSGAVCLIVFDLEKNFYFRLVPDSYVCIAVRNGVRVIGLQSNKKKTDFNSTNHQPVSIWDRVVGCFCCCCQLFLINHKEASRKPAPMKELTKINRQTQIEIVVVVFLVSLSP